MVVKLQAFLLDPRDVLQRYQADDTLLGRYAKAIALYRLPDLPAALEAVDGLIAEYPDDPYFHELKGQMLFENGRIEEAIPPYRQAVALRPDASLAEGRPGPGADRERRARGECRSDRSSWKKP